MDKKEMLVDKVNDLCMLVMKEAAEESDGDTVTALANRLRHMEDRSAMMSPMELLTTYVLAQSFCTGLIGSIISGMEGKMGHKYDDSAAFFNGIVAETLRYQIYSALKGTDADPFKNLEGSKKKNVVIELCLGLRNLK